MELEKEMDEWDCLWGEHSRLMDRMVEMAQKESVTADKNTVRVRVSVGMLWRVLRGGTVRFKTNDADIVITRSRR